MDQAHPHGPRHRPAGGGRLRRRGRRRASRPPGAGGIGPARRGQDQRRQGRARVRPLDGATSIEDVAAATRALAARAERLDPGLATTAFIREDRGGKVFLDSTRAGGATVVAAYSPRIRPGAPVSFPVPWDELDRVAPASFTLRTAAALVADRDLWSDLMPEPQGLPADLIEQGHTIPIARVQAMHEGKRRARARRNA
ncbi:hypothetical protein LUX33_08960 [Actinomadura madurae]|nr:hypothetical protein [Actinomadura madurae]MCP9948531.1 hypothetical protein [Actinomadura madurae]MCQ0010707.1 hypothetical protein [Actinomadura madurae]